MKSVVKNEVSDQPDFDVRLRSHLIGSGISLRHLADKAGVSVASLSLYLNAKQELSEKIFQRLLGALSLSPAEVKYLQCLREWKSGASAEIRLDALKKLYRIPAFRRAYKSQIETSNYLTQWLFVAIREFASLPEFRLDPKWIRKRLSFPSTESKIKSAIKFLIEKGFIAEGPDGKVSVSERDLSCDQELYLFSMGVYHRQMLDLAKQSLIRHSTKDRFIDGATLGLTTEDIKDFRRDWSALVDKYISRSAAKDLQNGAQQIFQIELALFPLTKTELPQSETNGDKKS